MRNNDEYRNNLALKKAIVIERDPEKMRVKARIEDEDATDSYWLDLTARSSSSTKSFDMPDQGDEIWAIVDPKGEEGIVMGSRYNDKETPPRDTNDDMSYEGPWGSFHLNKASGELSITLTNLNLQIDTITINGQRIEHNGKNIGHDHTHGGIVPGGSDTDIPNP